MEATQTVKKCGATSIHHRHRHDLHGWRSSMRTMRRHRRGADAASQCHTKRRRRAWIHHWSATTSRSRRCVSDARTNFKPSCRDDTGSDPSEDAPPVSESPRDTLSCQGMSCHPMWPRPRCRPGRLGDPIPPRAAADRHRATAAVKCIAPYVKMMTPSLRIERWSSPLGIRSFHRSAVGVGRQDMRRKRTRGVEIVSVQFGSAILYT